jgi:Uma2 family endonuclease
VLKRSSHTPKPPRLTLAVAKLFPAPGDWSEDEYLALPGNRIVELSDGKLVVPDLPSDPHQYAVFEFAVALRAFVKAGGLGQVRTVPLPVRLGAGKFREPDVLFMSQRHDDRRARDYWGVPDLVMEVISPRTKHSSGTESNDRKTKFTEYAQAGVSEYWIVETTPSVEVYALHDKEYSMVGRWGAGQEAKSQLLIGFSVAVSNLVEA